MRYLVFTKVALMDRKKKSTTKKRCFSEVGCQMDGCFNIDVGENSETNHNGVCNDQMIQTEMDGSFMQIAAKKQNITVQPAKKRKSKKTNRKCPTKDVGTQIQSSGEHSCDNISTLEVNLNGELEETEKDGQIFSSGEHSCKDGSRLKSNINGELEQKTKRNVQIQSSGEDFSTDGCSIRSNLNGELEQKTKRDAQIQPSGEHSNTNGRSLRSNLYCELEQKTKRDAQIQSSGELSSHDSSKLKSKCELEEETKRDAQIQSSVDSGVESNGCEVEGPDDREINGDITSPGQLSSGGQSSIPTAVNYKFNRKSEHQGFRGLGGWECSLRQNPGRSVPFQIRTSAVDTQPSKQNLENKKNERSLRRNRTKTSLFQISHNSKKVEPMENADRKQKRQSSKIGNKVNRSKFSAGNIVTVERNKQGQMNSSDHGSNERLDCSPGQRSTITSKTAKSSIDESTTTTDKVTECSKEQDTTTTTMDQQGMSPRLGDIVWGKFGRKLWWPAIVVLGKTASMRPADKGSSWIFWFGDHKISQIHHDKIVKFVPNYQSMKSNSSRKVFNTGILESIRLCGQRCGMNSDSMTQDDLLIWADGGFTLSTQQKQNLAAFDPIPGYPIPKFVLEKLKKIGDNVIEQRGLKTDSDDDEKDVIDKIEKKQEGESSGIAAVRNGKKKIEDICLGCDDVNRALVCDHPLFNGGLCQLCKDELIETMFAIGADGSNMFCAICGSGGKMFVCDDKNCNRTYCLECMSTFLREQDVAKIQEMNPWYCFLCTQYTKQTHGPLRPKKKWKENIIQLFDTGYRVQVPDLTYLSTDVKKYPLRVLSLFDGIGTGKLILDQLNLNVEVYYASEIDLDSMLCTSVNHGNSVEQIGDITRLTTHQIEKLGPIDLLIGGSPCNDLSLANPDRKGFSSEGTGCLFFDFLKILMTLQFKATQNGRHLFWMFENVASMKKEYSALISRFLECEPALWDAKFLSAQTRARYFWGNIPGMYSTPHLSDLDKRVELKEMLSPHCNRTATVSTLRTVTTKRNSLKQGIREDIFPVMMSGKEDHIWISELERVFGFPAHYTDIGNLPVTRRQRLLGKSWSVPVVKTILSPLVQYFAVKSK